MKEEDRMLLFLGWALLMLAIILLICRVTFRLDNISKQLDAVIEQLNAEADLTATATDAEETTEAKKEEPERAEIEILEQYRTEAKTATPADAEPKEEIITASEPVQQYAGNYELTAYIATGNPCADGDFPQTGFTAACNDPKLWHKYVNIDGYGTFYIHDTGGMASNVIDIFVDSYDEAIQFGRRSADVYILE